MTEYPLPESHSKAALIFLINFAFGVRVFLFFCTYIGESVFRSQLQTNQRGGFKRYVRYRKTGRARQAAGTGKHPPKTAARGHKPIRFVPAVIYGACQGSGRAYRAGTDRRAGHIRRNAAAGGRGRLCAGGRCLLCRGDGDHRSVHPAQKQGNHQKDGTDKPNRYEQEEKSQ